MGIAQAIYGVFVLTNCLVQQNSYYTISVFYSALLIVTGITLSVFGFVSIRKKDKLSVFPIALLSGSLCLIFGLITRAKSALFSIITGAETIAKWKWIIEIVLLFVATALLVVTVIETADKKSADN